MFKKMNWLMKLVLITAFAGFVFFVFAPVLRTFFDPQEFLTFLNPLGAGMPFGEYMINGWSWNNNEGDLIGFFRPLASATYIVEYPLFGMNPLGYKLVSMGIHLLCAVFVAKFVMLLSGKKWLALFAGALFTVHPGTLVATGMISARPDVMASLFSILALISTYSLSRNSKTTWKALVPAIFLLFSLASKELGMVNIITLPIMYFLWPGREKNKKNTIVFLSSLIVVGFFYFVVRNMIFGNVGGYGSYTGLTKIPLHLAILIAQATGVFFIKSTIVKLAVYLAFLFVIINYARVELERWRKVGVAALITGAYGFQSIIGDTATHYAYAPSLFALLFIVYFAERITISGPRGKQLLGGIAIIILLFAGVLTRRESLAFNHIYVDCEGVFNSLEEISDLLPDESGSVCFVVVSRDSAIQAEMKNVPMYMNSIDKNSQCEFVLIGNYEEATGSPVLVWEADRIVIR